MSSRAAGTIKVALWTEELRIQVPYDARFALPVDEIEIEVAGTRVGAQASIKPMYDPKSERVKA